MTNKALLALANRVEKLDGPCRETDAMITEVIILPFCEPPDCYPAGFRRNIEKVKAGGEDCEIERYTASIDAAMTLVPKDTDVNIYIEPKKTTVEIEGTASKWHYGKARTTSLAITAAALRAIAGDIGE